MNKIKDIERNEDKIIVKYDEGIKDKIIDINKENVNRLYDEIKNNLTKYNREFLIFTVGLILLYGFTEAFVIHNYFKIISQVFSNFREFMIAILALSECLNLGDLLTKHIKCKEYMNEVNIVFEEYEREKKNKENRAIFKKILEERYGLNKSYSVNTHSYNLSNCVYEENYQNDLKEDNVKKLVRKK